MGFPWDSDKPKNALNPFAFKPVWIDLAFRKRRSVPLQVKHRLTITLPDGTPVGPEGKPDLYLHSHAWRSRTKQRACSSPVRGGRWVTVVGATGAHCRRSTDGCAWGNDSPWTIRLSSMSGSHAPWERFTERQLFQLRPTAAGRGDRKVVSVVDRYPDQIPNAAKPVPLEAADGNHVIIRLAKGVRRLRAREAGLRADSAGADSTKGPGPRQTRELRELHWTSSALPAHGQAIASMRTVCLSPSTGSGSTAGFRLSRSSSTRIGKARQCPSIGHGQATATPRV